MLLKLDIVFLCVPTIKLLDINIHFVRFLSEMCWDCQAISQIGCWAFESLPCHFPFMRTFFFKPFESVAALWSVKRAREVGCEYKEACNRRSKWGGTGLEAGATGGGTRRWWLQLWRHHQVKQIERPRRWTSKLITAEPPTCCKPFKRLTFDNVSSKGNFSAIAEFSPCHVAN